MLLWPSMRIHGRRMEGHYILPRIGVGSKLKVRSPDSSAKRRKIFFGPSLAFWPPLFFLVLHFKFRWEIIIYWSAFLSSLSEYLLNICSKIWLWNEQQRICCGFKKWLFLVIYVIKVSGLFLRTYKFLQFVLYRQIVKC